MDFPALQLGSREPGGLNGRFQSILSRDKVQCGRKLAPLNRRQWAAAQTRCTVSFRAELLARREAICMVWVPRGCGRHLGAPSGRVATLGADRDLQIESRPITGLERGLNYR